MHRDLGYIFFSLNCTRIDHGYTIQERSPSGHQPVHRWFGRALTHAESEGKFLFINGFGDTCLNLFI